MWRVILFLFSLIYCDVLLAENRYLYGEVVGYNEYGEEFSLGDVDVGVQYTTLSEKTDRYGRFRLDLRKHIDKYGDFLKPGRRVNLEIKDPGWTILSPYEGRIFMPDFSDKVILRIKAVSNKSSAKVGSLRANFESESGGKPLYSVQILSTSMRDKALRVNENFRMDGYDSFIQVVKAGDGVVAYKVFAGGYSSRREALHVRNNFIQKYPLYKDAFVKLVVR